jgi:hypothetical protein
MPLSDFFLLPFRVLVPPLLETPLSTIPLPSTRWSVPLLLASFFAIVGGFVYCVVDERFMWNTSVDRNGVTSRTWIIRDSLSDQTYLEGIVIAGIFAFGGLSMIAVFSALSASKRARAGLMYPYVYRFAFTFPIWLVLAFEVVRLKLPFYTFSFRANQDPMDFTED